ncbi:MAG: hypothetical protein JW742_07245 [Candidatus Aminicenantes bacterium]|nr:hypothetical protein [Candidatus Aminicenantes bacterium]
MTFWPAVWLVVLALGVGGFTVVSILVAVKGYAEIKAILHKLKSGPDEGRDRRPS